MLLQLEGSQFFLQILLDIVEDISYIFAIRLASIKPLHFTQKEVSKSPEALVQSFSRGQ